MRSRNIKPAFFINEELADVSYQARLLFIGLWCYADRDGLFEWREKRIKAAIFPYDNADIAKLLMSLHDMTFIYKYCHNGKYYGQIKNFDIHQNPHPHEAKSKIQKPEQNQCHDTQVTLHEVSGECNADVRIEDTMIDDTRSDDKPPKTKKPVFDLPVWIDQEAWDGFVEMRKKIKAPLTDRAMNLAVKNLERLAGDPNDIINQSTQNCWKGLFEVKTDLTGNGTKQPKKQSQPVISEDKEDWLQGGFKDATANL